MSTIRSQFVGGNLEFDVFGCVTGTTTARQFPSVPASMARFKARVGNVGSFFIGIQPNTGSAQRMPFELEAGYDTGWFATDNLNRYWYENLSGSSEYLAYWLQK